VRKNAAGRNLFAFLYLSKKESCRLTWAYGLAELIYKSLNGGDGVRLIFISDDMHYVPEFELSG
jgi:hypothetical protein